MASLSTFLYGGTASTTNFQLRVLHPIIKLPGGGMIETVSLPLTAHIFLAPSGGIDRSLNT
jgi:hypothetical protein